MCETMAAVNGAGLAAPQIGVNLQLVIFGQGGFQFVMQLGTQFFDIGFKERGGRRVICIGFSSALFGQHRLEAIHQGFDLE